MQNSNTQNYNLLAPLQPVEPIPWSWDLRAAAPNKGAMEIGGLLSGNGRHNVHHDTQLRRHMPQQGYSMNHYALGSNGMIDPVQHYGMGHSSAMDFAHSNQPEQPRLMPSIKKSSIVTQNPYEADNGEPKVKAEPAAKNFICSTCPKAFARRSDLARHERIHSGNKPHRCDHPNCGKTFIQRSALTVHSRVHTGEKPHLCEICRKPFADSSSLARHRRTHSGQRPYRCPYANCQRTFTRRTTLTRHQNAHSGTLEQAAAEVHAGTSVSSAGRSFDDNQSDDQSPTISTVSALEDSSISPSEKSTQFPAQLHRQSSDIRYMSHSVSHGSILPPHMHHEYPVNMNGHHLQVSAPVSNVFANGQTHNQNQIQNHRNNITSNAPQSYGTTHNGGPVTTNESPNLSGLVWPSPNSTLPGPSTMDFSSYPDPGYHNNVFFPSNNNMRRPQSTEPEEWSLRSRHVNNHTHYGNHLQMGTEWNMGINLNVSEVKAERAYAM